VPISLILDIDVFGLGPLANPIPVLPVFRAILRDMNPEENFATTRILALLFAKLLATSGLR
jgi:hypothetical protein